MEGDSGATKPHVFKLETYQAQGPSTLSLRCPGCLQNGTFEALGQLTDAYEPNTQMFFGQRRCPNPKCHVHVFVTWNPAHTVFEAWPPVRIEFDATNLPAAVLASLDEAIACHSAGCYVAAAMMIRKTLEELCLDRKATGENLKARVRVLGKTIVLPKDLLAGLDDLRLLGNDAAHVESRTFNEVGRDEVEVALEFTKEVLKATYQYEALRQRMAKLKRGEADTEP